MSTKGLLSLKAFHCIFKSNLIFYFFCSHYADVDPENQNFLLESNLGKKKYETDFVS